MQVLSQSPFLQALGYAIANSLWQVALLWIIVVLINSLFKIRASSRYGIAFTAQAAGFIWFLVTLHFYDTRYSEAFAQAKAYGGFSPAAMTLPQTDIQSPLLSFVFRAERLLPYLSLAYLFLLIFLTLRWLRSYRYTQRLKTTGLIKPEVEPRLFVRKMAGLMGIRREILVYLSAQIKSPLTIGFLKPVILIPIASIAHLTTEQLEAVLLHELAHIRRADYMINLIQCLIELTLFFNPFTQLLSKFIRKERENSCDDWVLQFQYNASMYAEALLRIAYLQTQPVLAMQATGTRGVLLSRVKRILNQQEKTFTYRQQLMALVLMTGILSSVAWFQPQTRIPKKPLPETAVMKQEVAEPMAAKVDNPFFNPVFFLSKPLKEAVSKAIDLAYDQTTKSTGTALKNVADKIPDFLPAAMTALKDIPVDWTQLGKAGKEAQQEIAKIDWSAIKAKNPMLDTGVIAASLRKSFDQANLKILNSNLISQSLVIASNELAKISKDPSFFNNVFDQKKLQAAIRQAMESLQQAKLEGIQQKLDSMALSPALKAGSSLIPDINESPAIRLKLQKVELERKQLDSLRNMQDPAINYIPREQYQDTDVLSKPAAGGEAWKIINPVFTLPAPEMPAADQFVFPVNYLVHLRYPDHPEPAMNRPLITKTDRLVSTKSLDRASRKSVITITRSETAQTVNITIDVL